MDELLAGVHMVIVNEVGILVTGLVYLTPSLLYKLNVNVYSVLYAIATPLYVVGLNVCDNVVVEAVIEPNELLLLSNKYTLPTVL